MCFRLGYRLKNNGFKLFITGTRGVGKTMVSKRLQNNLKNNEALQVAEVDLLKNGFRKDVLVLKEKAAKHNFELSQLEWLGGEMNSRQTILDTCYRLDFVDIEKQSEYIFPRLIRVVERYTEKRIPAIIEGLNIPIDKLIKYYRDKKNNDPNFDLNSIIIVNLYVDSPDNLKHHIKSRLLDRKLTEEEREKQEAEISYLWDLNEYLREGVTKLGNENPDMHIKVINNSGIEDKDVAVRPILKLIGQTNNFIDW